RRGATSSATCAAACTRPTRSPRWRTRGRRLPPADDATTLATAGFVIGLVEHDYESAMNAIDHALALNGSSALALALGSTILAHDGRVEQAIEYGERALRLSPHDPTAYLHFTALAIAHLAAGRFE